RLVLVEGGWEDMGLSFLRNYADPEGREEVAEKFLRDGMISGEEYLNVVSDLEMSLWGIEDPKLYEENMETFLKIHAEQKEMLSALMPLEEVLKALQEKMFPELVLRLEKKKALFEDGKLSFLGYLQFLKTQEKDAGFWNTFLNLQKFLETSRAENGADAEKAEWEKQQLILALSKNLTKPELERVQIVETTKNPREELAFLQSLMGFYQKYHKRLGEVSTENIRGYAAMLREMAELDSREIFDELGDAEQKIMKHLLQTNDQRELAQISASFRLLKKLFELKLGPDEFRKFEKNPADFRLSEWQKFIQTQIQGLALENPLPHPDYKQIEGWIPRAEAFYQAAQKREDALIENTIKKVQADKDPLAAMIVGGFHSEILVNALKSRGYSVVTVMPRFTPDDLEASSQHYFEILKYKWGKGPASVNLIQS
ncbi:MAG TPA: hypothetical protein VD913_04470, partial [bacterium]|nr:hypothetical protein [bacterium]